MPRPLTQAEREEFLAEPHIGVLSVAAEDGRPPLTVPVWYAYEPGGDLTFFTGTGGRRARKIGLIDTAGTVSFCVQREQMPYRYVTVEGAVTAAARPPAAEAMRAVVDRYLPEDFAKGFVEDELARPDSHLVLYTVSPQRWITFDFAE